MSTLPGAATQVLPGASSIVASAAPTSWDARLSVPTGLTGFLDHVRGRPAPEYVYDIGDCNLGGTGSEQTVQVNVFLFFFWIIEGIVLHAYTHIYMHMYAFMLFM